MKKIIATITACTFALTMAQAQFNFMSIDSSSHNGVVLMFDPLGDNAGDKVTTTTGGYVASYWLKSASMADYALVGITTLGDFIGFPDDYALFWTSDAIIPRPGETPVNYSFELRVFKVDSIGTPGGDWGNEMFSAASLNDTSAAYDNAYKLWDDAYKAWDAGGAAEYGSWTGTAVMTDAGFTGQIGDWLGWSNTGNTLYLTANAIPEPSTWLLLGAGSAFVVIMRRRKK